MPRKPAFIVTTANTRHSKPDPSQTELKPYLQEELDFYREQFVEIEDSEDIQYMQETASKVNVPLPCDNYVSFRLQRKISHGLIPG